MKPPLAQYQANKRKEREHALALRKSFENQVKMQQNLIEELNQLAASENTFIGRHNSKYYESMRGKPDCQNTNLS